MSPPCQNYSYLVLRHDILVIIKLEARFWRGFFRYCLRSKKPRIYQTHLYPHRRTISFHSLETYKYGFLTKKNNSKNSSKVGTYAADFRSGIVKLCRQTQVLNIEIDLEGFLCQRLISYLPRALFC